MNKITDDQAIARLTMWEKRFHAIEDLNRSLNSIFKHDADSVLCRTLYDMFEGYTDALAEAVGDVSGPHSWLSWYIWDNECGTKGLCARAANWKSGRKITNVKILWELIKGERD